MSNTKLSTEKLLEKEAMIIKTSEEGWQNQVAKAMKAKKTLKIETVDLEWKPNSDNPLNIAKWIWGTALPGWVAVLLVQNMIPLGVTAYNKDDSSTPPKGIPLDTGEKLAIAAAGGLMLFGAGMILLAFFDPEPTTKLSLLVGGGIATVLGGGAIILTIIITRKKYIWEMEIDPKSGKAIWTARPSE